MGALFGVTFWTGLLTLFKMAIGFVITKFVAIYGGPSGVVLLGQLQAIVSAFNGVINSPVGSGIVRYTAEYHDRGFAACAPWWRAGVKYVICIYFLMLVLLAFFSKDIASAFLSAESNYWLVLVAGACLPFTALGTLISSIVNGSKNYKRYVVIGLVSTFFSFLLMAALIYYNNIHGALLSVCLQYALVGVFSVLFVCKDCWFTPKNFFGNINRNHYMGVASYISMAVVSAIALPTALLFIRNEMAAELGLVITGYWQAVWRISEVYLSFLTLALGVYYLPKLSSLGKKSELLTEVKVTGRYVFFIAVIMASVVYVFKDFIIVLLFSAEFLPAGSLFLLQLVGDCLKLNNWVYSFPMLARGAASWYISLEIFFAGIFWVSSFCLLNFTSLGVEAVLYSYILVQAVCYIFLRAWLKNIIH